MPGNSDEFGFFDEPGFDDFAAEPDFTDDLPFDSEGDWEGSDEFDDADSGFDADDFFPFDADPFETQHGKYADDWLNFAGDAVDEFVIDARKLREAGQAELAIDLLRDNLENDGPWDAPAHIELGLALEAAGKPDEAIKAFQQAVKLDPREPQALNHLGAALHDAGNDREALEYFAKANEVDPKFMPGYVNRILCHAELGAHDRAEAMFYLAQQLDERCPRSFFNMGRSLELRGLFKRAIWCYRRCIALDTSEPMVPRGAVVTRLAQCLLRDKQTAMALRCLREGLGRVPDTDPSRAELLETLAGMLLDGQDPIGAKPVIAALTTLQPNEPATLTLWGRLHMLNGEPDLAWEALTRAAAGDPTFPRVHLQLAQLASDRGDLATAQRHLRAELLRRPRDVEVLHAVARQAEAIGDHAGAAVALRKLVLVLPNDAAIWQWLGVAECETDRPAEGLNALRRCLELDPKRVSAWHNLALALARHGDLAHARQALRHGLHLDPASIPLRRLRWRLRLRWLLRV